MMKQFKNIIGFVITSIVITFSSFIQASQYDSELLRLTNIERQNAGLSELTLSSQLGQAAQNHAEDMANNNYFSHTGLNASSAGDRISATGYSYSTWGENISAGRVTASDTIQGWMNSQGHRDNILNSNYSEIGFGYANSDDSDYQHYWVQVFGKSSVETPKDTSNSLPEVVNDDISMGSPVYRFFSGKNNHFFYTISADEKDWIISDLETWEYEYVGYNAYKNQVDGTVPVYRFWSDNKQVHFFTTSAEEKDWIMNNFSTKSWNYERISWYVYKTEQPNTIPVYRFWSDTFQGHLFTADVDEKNRYESDPNWTYERIAFYTPNTLIDLENTDTTNFQQPDTSTDSEVVNDNSFQQQCVDKINEYRATENLPPLQRWSEQESCTDKEAKLDSESGKSHGAFGTCQEMAQNECPGYSSTSSILTTCLQQMWNEGPGESFQE
ncbi:CAP domain-containing protein, partial [Thiotrichales bacterium HSG1]|nr:CAP domain-containing protein [Thiotrichales bacterium HSG1]